MPSSRRLIKENLNLCELPDGTRVHKMTLASNPTTPRRELGGRTFFDVTGGKYPDHPEWKIWIITEADRSCTTILFPNEY